MSTPPTPPPPTGGSTTPQSTATPSTTPTPTPATEAKPAVNPAKPVAGAKPPPPPEPLKGFRAALEHTGIPRSVLLWKPRLPSRNWCIFWVTVGTVSYLYYDDRRQCEQIKQRTVDRVKALAEAPTAGSLDEVRKVKVYGARWPEDDDTDRALRHFRKYIKPYLVAAAVDYEQVQAPLYGSITRQVHAATVNKRRRALGLETPQTLSLPGVLDPQEMARREVEGGEIIVGRHTLKEYLEGLRRGYSGGVDTFDWEKAVEEKVKFDGVFESPPEPVTADVDVVDPAANEQLPPLPGATPLSFLSRPSPPTRPLNSNGQPQPPAIPAHLQVPPAVLPPHPPVLLVPYTSYLGFKQIPQMVYNFFTERYRVQEGADAALALIENHIRPFDGPSNLSDPTLDSTTTNTDLDFDKASEKWYKKDWKTFPERVQKQRDDYYVAIAPKLQSARDLASGARGLTDEEKSADKPATTEQDLRAERQKKELRWSGNEEGYSIIKEDVPVAWDPRFNGWLRKFELPQDKASE